MFTSLTDFCTRHFQELSEDAAYIDNTSRSKNPQKHGEYIMGHFFFFFFLHTFYFENVTCEISFPLENSLTFH